MIVTLILNQFRKWIKLINVNLYCIVICIKYWEEYTYTNAASFKQAKRSTNIKNCFNVFSQQQQKAVAHFLI